MPKALTLNKLEGLHYFLNEAIDAGTFDHPVREDAARARQTLAVLAARIDTIKGAAPDQSEHQPRMYCMMGRPVRIGCSCTWFPANAPKRMSTMGNDFMAHLRKLNLDQHAWEGKPILYADGPYAGKSWEQAYAEDGAAKL